LIQRGKFREDAFPVLLKSSEALGDPRRADHARAFLRTMPPDAPERPLAWKIVCRDGSTWWVLSTWAALPAPEKTRTDFVVPLLDRMLTNELHDHARQLIDSLPTSLPVEIEVRRLRLDLAAPRRTSSITVQRDLARRLAQDPEDALPLLGLLDEIPQSELLIDTSESWLQALAGPPPDLPTLDRMRLARLEMAAEPERADSVFDQAFRLHRTAERLATVRFCMQTGRLAVAEELVRETDLATDPEAHRLARQIAELTENLDWWQELVSEPL
jgi:hypothetical protein